MPRYRYEPEVYTPAAIRYGYLKPAEARAEYARLRAVAQKRLQRLSASEQGRKGHAYQLYGKEGFAPLPRDASPTMIGRELAAVYHFLELKTSSLAAMKETSRKTLETLKAHGFTKVNAGNLREFGDFMEAARQKGIARQNRGGSYPVAELYETVKRLNIPAEQVEANFTEYLRKRRQLEALPTINPKTKKPLSSADIEKRLRIKKEKR